MWYPRVRFCHFRPPLFQQDFAGPGNGFARGWGRVPGAGRDGGELIDTARGGLSDRYHNGTLSRPPCGWAEISFSNGNRNAASDRTEME